MALADWTWMVYLAGDNNLEGAAVDDLNEMQQVGSSDRLNVVVTIIPRRRGRPLWPRYSRFFNISCGRAALITKSAVRIKDCSTSRTPHND